MKPPEHRAERDYQTLSLVARGLSNVEITTRLTATGSTVKTHAGNPLAAHGCRDRAQAVVHAYERRLMQPGHNPPG
jgi:ATP/maltotriose-dependent transcriptional regulator MalT